MICRSITAGVDALLAGEALPGHLPAVLSCFNSLTSCPQLSPVVMNRAERLVSTYFTRAEFFLLAALAARRFNIVVALHRTIFLRVHVQGGCGVKI